jgi:hypothetical protein
MEHLNVFPRPRTDSELLRDRCGFLALGLSVLIGGCGLFGGGGKDGEFSDEQIAEMTPVVRARHVEVLRDGALLDMQAFKNSKGENLEALKEYTEKHRQTTRIIPQASECPNCYLFYGDGLRILGNYYWTLSRKLEIEAEKAAREDATKFRSKAKEHRATSLDYFRRSNQQYETAFSAGSSLDATFYLYAIENATHLNDLRSALEYLAGYARVVRPPPEERERVREWIERQRARFKQQYDRQQEDKLREELKQAG